MRCSSCGGYMTEDADQCPTCGKTVSDEALASRIARNHDRSRAFDALVAERQRDMEAFAAAKSTRVTDEIPSSSSQDLPYGLPTIADHFGIRIKKAPKGPVSERIATESVSALRELMADFGISSESSLQELFDIAERCELGIELWTSPKRRGHQKFRCKLYVNEYWTLRCVVLTEAATAWAAVVTAIMMGVEQEHFEWVD